MSEAQAGFSQEINATKEGSMSVDLWSLYGMMYKSRTFERAVKRMWQEGRISG